METSAQSQSILFPGWTCSSEVSLASPSQALDNVEASLTPVERSFLSFAGYSKASILDTLFSRTCRGFSLMTMEGLSKPSSPRFKSWGIAWNGNCVTADITAYRRVGRACTLSDILEESPHRRYFLSFGRMRNFYHNAALRLSGISQETEESEETSSPQMAL